MSNNLVVIREKTIFAKSFVLLAINHQSLPYEEIISFFRTGDTVIVSL